MENNKIDIVSEIKKKYPKFYVIQILNDNNNIKFSPENDDGDIEYKRTLVACSIKKEESYATQMRWRILNNKNHCATYYIGVDDDGTIIGLNTTDVIECICRFVPIAKKINASISRVEIINLNGIRYIIKICVKNKKIKDNYIVDFD